MTDFKNVFACLVQGDLGTTRDLVSNLRCLDPASDVLLYHDGGDASLLVDDPLRADPHIVTPPAPKARRPGASRVAVFDCLAWAGENLAFDTLTLVDGDQLLLRPGYSERLRQIWTRDPAPDLLHRPPGATAEADGGPTLTHAQRQALAEFGAWKPFLLNHGAAFDRFPRWTFRPGTVLSRHACRQITGLLRDSLYLRALLGRSRINPVEEVALPTLADALGLSLAPMPLDVGALRTDTPPSVQDLEDSLRVPDRFWLRPVPGEPDHPLRAALRRRYGQYREPPAEETERPTAAVIAGPTPAPPRPAIPKIIHHIWVGGGPIPAGMAEMREGWRRHHRGWEMRLWTDDTLPPLRNRALYESRDNTGHRADVLRYELLRDFGGVYVDFDFECRRPLDALIAGCEGFAGRHRPVTVSTCTQYMEIAILGAAPGHPLFAQAVDALPAWHAAHETAIVPVRTGPQFFQAQYEAWRAAGRVYGGREATFTLFPPEVFYPYNWKERALAKESFPEAYAVHHWWSTWLEQPDSPTAASDGGSRPTPTPR